ncbi:MAG: HIT family protein [Chloroflexi bacterium]|nr:HIT family protein [Chloroflexota bacterium]
MNDCKFCDPFVNPTEIVLENDLCIFLQHEETVLIGAGLIIPRAHHETVFDLTPGEWVATREMIHQVKSLLDETYHPDGYTVGWNCGEAGGQHVFHAHLHIIPRYKDEPFAGKGLRHWLKQEENKRK